MNAYAPPFTDVGVLLPVTQRLVDAASRAGVSRFVMVGGAGGLNVHGSTDTVINQPWFPADWKPIAQAHIDAFAWLKTTSGNWTYFAPPGMFTPGERTGKFRLDTDTLVATEAGSSCSMEDYAVALVDELENPRYERQRFTIGY